MGVGRVSMSLVQIGYEEVTPRQFTAISKIVISLSLQLNITSSECVDLDSYTSERFTRCVVKR